MIANPTRSILDLTLDELEQVINTNELPDGVGLQGIENRKDFDKLFRHRLNPKYIAQALVRDKATKPQAKGPSESEEVKKLRLELKQKEIDVRTAKAQNQTEMNQRIMNKLLSIESAVQLLAMRVEHLITRSEPRA